MAKCPLPRPLLYLIFCLAICLAVCPLSVQAEGQISGNGLGQVKSHYTVVIDPGHGGENKGTESGTALEKEMTLVTAQALYDELSRYDNVTVYLTRWEDPAQDIKMADRAGLAAQVEADFLFSIHYNASEEHTLFGSEVWVPLKAPFNVYGYRFATLQLAQMEELGLFVRGVKTREGSKGDYYGILRECAALGIPAVIIEHCHVDEPRDASFCASREQWELFGQKDALAIAQFLGLKSQELGVDYSTLSYESLGLPEDVPVALTLKDETPPQLCRIEALEVDYEGGTLTCQVTGYDPDSPMMYYAYSLNGGESFSPLQPWPGSRTALGEYEESFPLTLEVPEGSVPRVVLRAYNMYDGMTASNLLEAYERFPEKEAQTPAPRPAREPDVKPVSAVPVPDPLPQKTDPLSDPLILVLGCGGAVFACLIFILAARALAGRGRGGRQPRNRRGDSSSQPR